MEQELNQYQPKRIIALNGLLIGFLAAISSLIIVSFFISLVLINKYQSFLTAAQMSHSDVIAVARKIVNSRPEKISTLNFLILGLDSVANRAGDPQLTDTILLAQLDTKQAQLELFSLPRDLWSKAYQTKINALYHYGKDKYPQSPERFTQEVISDLTGFQPDYTFVLTLDQIGQLIDLVGGVEINVAQGFVDTEFPRDDVDIRTVTDPNLLYETVEFQAGNQVMNGEKALKYIRSRHSGELESGTDLARANRQQQVIQALLNQLAQPQQYWSNPELAGKLVAFYQENFSNKLPLEQAGQVMLALGNNISNMEISSIDLTVYPEDPDGLIEHPTSLRPYDNQWVYIIRDPDVFKQELAKTFN